MMESGQLRDPFGARSAKERGPLLTEGSYRNGKTEIYRKGKWEPVNIIHAGQRAMVNGKMRTADGQGNWYDPKDPGKYSHETGEFERQTYGTYKPGKDRTPSKPSAYKPKPGVKPSSSLKVEDNRTGSVKKPSAYPTEAALTTIKPSRDYQKEASIDLPTDDRHDTRIDSKGNIQTGTNTGPKPMTMDDANKILSGGYKIENPYSSNQLPTTASSPYAGKSNSQIYNQDTLHQHNSDVDYVKLSKDIYGDQSGVELSTRNGGMKADYKQMDVNPGQNVPEEKINWANRTMADNSDEKVRRRSAMLDGDVGIMQAMRNQEAIQGRVYAGGKHWQRNKDAGQEGQNDFVEISAKQANDRSYYRQSADEVFNNHLGKAKETAASQDIPDLPKDAPAPLPDAVPHNTTMDKSPFDTSELLGGTQSPPNMESIIDDDKPYVGMQKYNPFR